VTEFFVGKQGVFCDFPFHKNHTFAEISFSCEKYWTNGKNMSIIVGIKCVFKEEQTL
jgi:hypothetical protein